MAVVASVDYTAKRIYLGAATVDRDLDALDIYREVRALRAGTDAHRRFRPLIEAGGNIEKIPGVSYTPAYVRLLHGCRIVPYNISHKLRLIRDTFTDDGLAGVACFDRTPLSPAVTVDIDVDFPEIEIRLVSVNGSVGPTAEQIVDVLMARQIAAGLPVDRLLRHLAAFAAGRLTIANGVHTAHLPGTDTPQIVAEVSATERNPLSWGE